MSKPNERVPANYMLWGAGLIVLGILATISNVGILDLGNVIGSGIAPFVVTGIGVAKWRDARNSDQRRSASWFLVIGLWWFFANLQLFGGTDDDYWPLLLIAIGALIIWHAMMPSKCRADDA